VVGEESAARQGCLQRGGSSSSRRSAVGASSWGETVAEIGKGFLSMPQVAYTSEVTCRAPPPLASLVRGPGTAVSRPVHQLSASYHARCWGKCAESPSVVG